MKFRKKAVVIEAVQYLGGYTFDEMTVDWGESFGNVARHQQQGNFVDIKTLEEGVMTAHVGDWIIKGIKKGEFYPCKPDIFAATYEPV